MRHFLFLQGNASPFFLELGKALDANRCRVSRINICGGDFLFWGNWNAVDYTGRAEEFGAFVADFCKRHSVTDLVLHNDCRTTHRLAIQECEVLGIAPWVFEEGYLRPHWLTLEKGGINGFSQLPDDPEWFRSVAKFSSIDEDWIPVGGGMRERVLSDFRWQWANYRYFYRYPKYKTHRPYPIWKEYLTWVKRLSTIWLKKRKANELIAKVISEDVRYFVFPLQLDTDSQIRVHSEFKRMSVAIDAVIASFASSAPYGTHLIIKNHPLDNGWISYARHVSEGCRGLGVERRVHFVDGGDLHTLLRGARGVVTVNSTVGLTSLDAGTPVICLGKAIYDVEGLTSKVSLDDFWVNPGSIDERFLKVFKNILREKCLVNGNFYTSDGVKTAVSESVVKILGRT